MTARSRSAAVWVSVQLLAAACGSTETRSPAPLPAGPDGGADVCAPGEASADGGCVPAGIAPEECGKGFVPDGTRGCAPILPPRACPDGWLAIPGEQVCRVVMPCPLERWGDIRTRHGIRYVDAAYGGGASDGTMDRPWTTIQEALDDAEAGEVVAVEAGTYAEDIDIDRAITVWGVCPEKVAVAGTSAGAAAVNVNASGAIVRGIAVTGAAAGIAVWGAANVELDRLWVHDTADRAVAVVNEPAPATVAIHGCLIERPRVLGVSTQAGCGVTLDGCVVRDVLPQLSDDDFGLGLGAQAGASLTLLASVVERTRTQGIIAFGADVTLDASVIQDTLGSAVDESLGTGVVITHDVPGSLRGGRGRLEIARSFIARSRSSGVLIRGSDATITATVVRDTLEPGSMASGGRGVDAMFDAESGQASSLAIAASVIEGSHEVGCLVGGSDATIDRTIVRRTAPTSAGVSGRGIEVTAHPLYRGSLALTSSIVEQSHEAGLLIAGASASLVAVVVRDTAPRVNDARGGHAIHAQFDVPAAVAPEDS